MEEMDAISECYFIVTKMSPTSSTKYRLFPALMFSLKEDPGSLLYD